MLYDIQRESLRWTGREKEMLTEFWLRQHSEVQTLWEDIFKLEFRKMKRIEMKWSSSGFTFSRVVTRRPALLVTATLCTVLRYGDFQQGSTAVGAGKPKQWHNGIAVTQLMMFPAFCGWNQSILHRDRTCTSLVPILNQQVQFIC
jgi:hypothetical protein